MIKQKQKDGKVKYKPSTYIYAFIAVPLDASKKARFLCGLRSNQGTGDARVFTVLNNIKTAFAYNDILLYDVVTDGDKMYSA